MRSEKERKRRIWWIPVAIIIIALIIYLLIPRPVEIEVARVIEDMLEIPLSSTGVVESELSDVSPQITARITALYASEGQTVEEGAVLARLQSDALQAEVRRLEAAVRAAAQEVAARESAASAEAAQLRAAAERARATLSAARERLRELEAGARIEDIEVQRAAVAQARARAENARQTYVRAQRLYEAGAIPAQELDNARANYEAAQAALEAQIQQLRRLEAGARTETLQAARAEVNAAQAAYREAQAALGLIAARNREIAVARARQAEAQAALEAARAQLSYTVIRSPIRGLVVRKHKEVGETAAPLDPIYTVADLGQIWVTAEVDEEDVAAVEVGQEVSISVDAYPGREAIGRVVRVSRIAEPKEVGRVRAKVVRARITIERSEIPLRPGMEVTVTGTVPADRETLLVPNDAVIRLGDMESVYVIRGGEAHVQQVETGQSNFEKTQILSGLREGQTVAVSNLDDLSDGERVRVVE